MARILGVEIADKTIRTALLHAGFRKMAIERVDELAIEEHEAGSESARHASIAASLKRLLSDMERAPDAVSIALDGRELSLRQLDFPIGTLKRIPELLPFEIESLLPFEVDGAILSHQESERGADTVSVLAAAAPKSLIREELERYRSYGLEPRYLCPGAAALDGLVPLVPSLAEASPTLLLAIHDEASDLSVIKNGKTVFARTLSRGRRVLDSQMSASFFGELRASLAAYRSQGGEKPSSAHLLLADELPPAIDAKLRESLGMEPEPIALPPTAAGTAIPERFAFAVALAGRGATRDPRIDLRKGEFAPPRTSGILLRHWKLLAACLAAILASFIFSIVMRQSILESERDHLREKLAVISKDLLGEEVRSAARARALLGGSLAPDDPMPRFDAFDALDTVSREMPGDIVHHLRKFVVEIDDEAREGKLEMHGRVSSITERDQLAQALEAAECFERVNPGPTNPARGGEEGLNYRLDIEIRCPGDEPASERRP